MENIIIKVCLTKEQREIFKKIKNGDSYNGYKEFAGEFLRMGLLTEGSFMGRIYLTQIGDLVQQKLIKQY